MIKKSIFVAMVLGAFSLAGSAASILDIKHSITNDNVIPPESFETKTRELEENFYLKNYIDNTYTEGASQTGTAEEYEEYLKRLPVEVEMPYNSIVGKFINMYLGKRRRLVSDMLALHSFYGPMFQDALAAEGVPQELQYLPVIESAINPNAVSRAGATGLWQLMPSTAKGLGLEVNSLVDQSRDPVLSTRQAVRLLKQLHDIYNDWSLAIAAYNCGPGRVNQALRKAGGGKKDFWEIYRFLPSETRDYIPAFIAANYVMNYHGKYGIQPTVIKRPLITDRVEVKDRIHFRQIAEVLNIPIEEIRMLNPQFRKDIIPGNHHPYYLTLPKQQCLSYIMSEEAIKNYNADEFAQRTHVEPGESRTKKPAAEEVAVNNNSNNSESSSATAADRNVSGNVVRKVHVVQRGENLRDIAKKYNVSATDIKHWNKLRRGKVKEGDELVIEVMERSLAQSSSSSAVPAPRRQEKEKETVVPMPKERKSDQSANSNSNSERSRYSTGGSNSSGNHSVSSSRKNKHNDYDDRSRSKAAKKNSAKAKKKPAKPVQHTVTKGESLEKIARKNGITVDELRKANGMKKNQDVIQIGQKLKVPQKGSGSDSKSVKKSKKEKNSGSSKSSKSKGSKSKSSKNKSGKKKR